MSLELEVTREIQSLRSLDLDKLSQTLRKLPMPSKFASVRDIPDDYHLCSDQRLLDELFNIFERFPFEEDFGLWAAVENAIELFEETRIGLGLVASFKQQPMCYLNIYLCQITLHHAER